MRRCARRLIGRLEVPAPLGLGGRQGLLILLEGRSRFPWVSKTFPKSRWTWNAVDRWPSRRNVVFSPTDRPHLDRGRRGDLLRRDRCGGPILRWGRRGRRRARPSRRDGRSHCRRPASSARPAPIRIDRTPSPPRIAASAIAGSVLMSANSHGSRFGRRQREGSRCRLVAEDRVRVLTRWPRLPWLPDRAKAR